MRKAEMQILGKKQRSGLEIKTGFISTLKSRRFIRGKKLLLVGSKERCARASVWSCFLLLLTSCSMQPENPLTQPEKFAEVYSVLQVAAAQDSAVAARVDSILRHCGYTRAQFDEAVRYYNAHAEEWGEVVQESVAVLDSLARVEAREDSLKRAEPNKDKTRAQP